MGAAYVALCIACAERRLDVELLAGDTLFKLSEDDKIRWRRITGLEISSAGRVIEHENVGGIHDLDRAATTIRTRVAI